MFIGCCCLSKYNSYTTVVYFDKMTGFCEEHSEDTFVQWQKCQMTQWDRVCYGVISTPTGQNPVCGMSLPVPPLNILTPLHISAS